MVVASPVPLLHFLHQLIGGKLPPNDHNQILDDILRAVNVQQTTDHHRQTTRVHLKTHKAKFEGICSYEEATNGVDLTFCT